IVWECFIRRGCGWAVQTRGASTPARRRRARVQSKASSSAFIDGVTYHDLFPCRVVHGRRHADAKGSSTKVLGGP
ncbi:hypothetical protein E4U43_004114, partial [Claviceps pusilla]